MSTTTQMEPLAKTKSKQMINLLKSDIRLDGRHLLDFRETKVETAIIDKAEGSASVILGNTKVLVGIKAEIGEPFLDTPNQAVFTVNAEFVPLAHKFFEPGPPDENSIGLARIVDRGIRASNMVELQKLVLIPGQKVYVMFVDIYILNHDGNLVDASEFAAVASLLNTKIPKYEVSEKGEVKKLHEYFNLPIQDLPISATFAKIGDKILLDPTSDEENMAEAKLTITLNKDGKICAIQKNGSDTFTIQEIMEIQKIARQKTSEIRQKVFKDWC